MLRNLQRYNHRFLILEWSTSSTACISTACRGAAYAKADSLNFQSKVLSKLVGHRVSGSKKRWYPHNDGNTSNSSRQRNAEMFKSAHITKSTVGGVASGGGKNTTRRMVVLNKLFMKHITDLLATGEASEAIVGRGLQVTRVKISPDFANINVYWFGSGDAFSDALLDTELQRCSGILRHELSQLMLMSEVPRVKFAREKKLTNVAQVEQLLRSIDFGHTEETTDGSNERVQQEKYNLVANMMQREFYGKNPLQEVSNVNASAECEKQAEQFPEMRHDVLGLDHRLIMSKLMTKMRRSQQAWEQHADKQSTTPTVNDEPTATRPSESLERVRQKLAEAAENAERFEKFLAKRREQRNTPERKRHDHAADWLDERAEREALDASAAAAAAAEALLTPTQRRLLEADDYLHEDDERSEANKR